MAHNSNFKFKSEKQRMKVMSILNNRAGGGNRLKGQVAVRNILEEKQLTTHLQAKKRQDAVLDKLAKKDVVLHEGEIQHIANNLNSGTEKREKFGKMADNLIWNNSNGVMVTEAQNQKGLEFLNRPNIRKNMGYRELDVLDNFKEFRLKGFHDVGNSYRRFYVPYWEVIANDGSTFEYNISSNGIDILG